MTDVVIVSAARTAVGKFGGALAKVPAVELGAIAIGAAMERAGVAPGQISEVMMGHVLTAGLGQNPARQAAIKAGLAYEVPAMTVNMVCGSGLRAVMLAADSILSGNSGDCGGGRTGEYECRAPCAARIAGRFPDGRSQTDRQHDRGRVVGCVQPISHGDHGGECGQAIRHQPRGAGCIGGDFTEPGRSRTASGSVQGGDCSGTDSAAQGRAGDVRRG